MRWNDWECELILYRCNIAITLICPQKGEQTAQALCKRLINSYQSFLRSKSSELAV
jgi:hypothetical protein